MIKRYIYFWEMYFYKINCLVLKKDLLLKLTIYINENARLCVLANHPMNLNNVLSRFMEGRKVFFFFDLVKCKCEIKTINMVSASK